LTDYFFYLIKMRAHLQNKRGNVQVGSIRLEDE